MNVNKIYKLIKNAVCLQCRKDKAIYDMRCYLLGQAISEVLDEVETEEEE